MSNGDSGSAGPSILSDVNEVIDNALDLKSIGKAPHHKHKESCLKLTKEPMKGLDVSALIEDMYGKITRNWHESKSRGKDNWRWKPNTEIKKEKKKKSKESKEVILERLIVRTAGKEWVNQVPVSSGLTKVVKLRQSFDKRRAVDLVHRCGEGRYEFIELKVASDTPLYAAMEILQYGLLYVFYRENLNVLEPEELTKNEKELLGAKDIQLKVLAPQSYYEGYKLELLEGMIKDRLKAFLAGRKFDFKIEMDFEFQRFPLDFNLDAVVSARKSPDPRITEALNQRKPVCLKHT